MIISIGGAYRNVRIVNGKAKVLVKAVVAIQESGISDALKICQEKSWGYLFDFRNNLAVTKTVSIDAFLLSDSVLMDAYLQFAEDVALSLTGNKNRYLMAGVASFDEVA